MTVENDDSLISMVRCKMEQVIHIISYLLSLYMKSVAFQQISVKLNISIGE
jgi:hypothetical protein